MVFRKILDGRDRAITALVCACSALGISWCLWLLFGLGLTIMGPVTVFFGLTFWVVAQKINADQSALRLRLSWTAISLLAMFGYLYIVRTFGYFDLDSIFMHLGGGAGVADLGWSLFLEALPFIAGVIATLTAISLLKGKGILRRGLDMALAVFFISINVGIVSVVKGWTYPEAFKTFVIDHYVEPPRLASLSDVQWKDGAPKNFVHIFLESTEATFLDEDAFGPIMRPLRPWSETGFQAKQMEQITMLRSSLSGMTGSTCGVPMYFIGIISARHSEVSSELYPGLNCLGDVLEPAGYNLAHVTGWPLDFMQHASLYSAHGYNSIYGPDEANAVLPGILNESNVISDDSIAAMSLVSLRKLAKADKPFGLTIATNGGHRPHGYMAPACEGRAEISGQLPSILQAMHCTNLLIAEFLEQANAEGLLENTIIVLQSDHLLPPSPGMEFPKEVKRLNYFSISGAGIESASFNKPSSVLDVFPTLLEAVGVPLDKHKAGLGVSMLSDMPTLTDVYQANMLNKLLQQDRHFKHRMWTPNELGEVQG